MVTVPTIVRPKPGINRDDTNLDKNGYYQDALWCRWQRGVPEKIGGFTVEYDTLGRLAFDEISRGLGIYNKGNSAYVHSGGAAKLQQCSFTLNTTVPTFNNANRTPVGFVSNAAHNWQMDLMYSSAGGVTQLIAHPARNLYDITDSTQTPIYIGQADATAPLTAVGGSSPSVSGGVCVLHPYLLLLDNDGVVHVSTIADPAAAYTTARIGAQKLVKALPLRNSAGGGPAGLIWSLDSLIRAGFVSSGGPIFQFDTISSQSSILSSNGVIEYDGVYYWPGVDRFLMFDGVLRELRNDLNREWFYKNVNYAARQKCFTLKVPRFGEIWFCFPYGNAEECTHAVIYNVRENTWYDTELPGNGRSAGVYAQVFEDPLIAGVDLENFYTPPDPVLQLYPIWHHEFGVDKRAFAGTRTAVRSYFETGSLSYVDPNGGEALDRTVRITAVEPDFNQVEDMQLVVKGQSNSRASVISETPITFSDSAATSQEQILRIKAEHRFLRLQFISDTIDGDYEMGRLIAHLEPGTGRQLT